MSLADPEQCDHDGLSRYGASVDAGGTAQTHCVDCGARLVADVEEIDWQVDHVWEGFDG